MSELKNTIIDDTGYLQLPTGSDNERPNTPHAGYIRFNTDKSKFEAYDSVSWKVVEYNDIPRDGLMAFLDAGNPSSYSGNGSTWLDLSGNGNNAIINGTNTFTNTDGGKFDYRGNSQTTNYITLPESVLQSNNGTFTLIYWIQPQSNGDRYFNSIASSTNDNLNLFEINGGSISSWEGGSSISFTENEWMQLSITRTNSNSGTLRKNISSTVSITLSNPSTVSQGGWILNQEQDSVGGGFNSNQNAFAAFSIVLFYNRELSLDEITKIHDFFSVRYN